MQTIPATAYFDHILLPKERKLPLPGNVWSNVVIALRASNVQDGQQYLASYGTGTTRAMCLFRQEASISKRNPCKCLHSSQFRVAAHCTDWTWAPALHTGV